MADEPDGQAVKTFTQAEVEALIATEVTGLKAKRDELLGKVTTQSERLKAFDGLDPEKARNAMSAAEKAEAAARKAAGDWEGNEKRLRDEWSAEHTKVVTPLQQELEAAKADLFDAVAVRDAMEAMVSKDVNAYPKLAMPLIRHELDVVLVDGKRVTAIKGADGKPRYHPTTGKLFTVEDRLKELRTIPDYAGAFQGSGGSGGGAEQGQASAAGVITLTREQASDAGTYQAALKQVGGDYAKVLVK